MPEFAEKSAELLKRLNTLAGKDGGGDLFRLKKIEQEANQLRKIDAVGAYMVLGALACLRKDPQGVKMCYEKAIKLAPNDGWIKNSYAISLLKLCQFEDAKMSARHAYDLSQRSDLTALKTLIDASLLMGQIQEAHAWLDEWAKKSPRESYPLGKEIIMAKKTLQHHAISDQEAGQFLQVAYDILGQKGYCAEMVDFAMIDSEPFYRIRVNGDADEIADLNFDLADTLAENDFIPRISQAMSVMYLPAIAHS